MRTILVSDTTLCRDDASFSFKEKTEIVRQLCRLNADVIELPAIRDPRADVLLVRSVAPMVSDTVLSVCGGMTEESIALAAQALTGAAKPRIRIELPTSTVGMEYTCHQKAAGMLKTAQRLISCAKAVCADVELCALDATRADTEYLGEIFRAAKEAGASCISVCDTAAELMPLAFLDFVRKVSALTSLPFGIKCEDKNSLALANSILAAQDCVSWVKTAVGGSCTSTEAFAEAVKNNGEKCGIRTALTVTELNRAASQIAWIASHKKKEVLTPDGESAQNTFVLHAANDRASVAAACANLGYDLNEEDITRVCEEVALVAQSKEVSSRDLEAIIASNALQVPSIYRLSNYVLNCGNQMSATVQVTLIRGDELCKAVCIGDGPVDAAFRAVEQIIGHHFELDDFQIQSVTAGKEAMGSALVKLRSRGTLYSGSGTSTDIIYASIRAYLNAVNKIIYEEVSK